MNNSGFFVEEKYADFTSEIQREYGFVLCDVAFFVLNSDEKLLIDFMNESLSTSESQTKEGKVRKHDPLLNRNSLFYFNKKKKQINISVRSGKALLKYEVNSNSIKNEIVCDYFNQIIKDKTFEEKKHICKEMFLIYGDVAAHIKMMTNAKIISFDYYNCLKRMFPGYNADPFRKTLLTRNLFEGHKSIDRVSRLSREKFVETMTNHATALKTFASIDEESIRKKIFGLIQKINANIEKSKMEPISVADLKKKYSEYEFSEEYFDGLIIKSDFDSANGILYFHTDDEVKKIIEEKYQIKCMNRDFSKLQKENEEKTNKLIKINSILREEAINSNTKSSCDLIEMQIVDDSNLQSENVANGTYETAPKDLKKLFPTLSIYERGYLNDIQINELAKNTNLVATSAAWMMKPSRKFIAYQLKDIMKNNERRMLVDWNTRVELFKIEQNKTGSFSEEKVRNAKSSHHVIHMMHNNDDIVYLPENSHTFSSIESIANIANDNPTSLFTVICDKQCADYVIDAGIKNIIPLMVLPTGKCRVWPDNIAIIRSLFNDNRENDEKKELDFDLDSKEHTLIEDVIEKKEESAKKNKDSKKKESNAFEKIVLVENDEKKIPVENIPKNGDTVFKIDGKSIILNEIVGSGAEGTIYSTNNEKIAAKIFNRNTLTTFRFEKIKLMISKKVEIKELCWPQSLLYNEDNQFIGYTMPLASGYEEFGKSVMKLNSPTIIEKMKSWDRLTIVELCISLCTVFSKLQKQTILMGDINPRNFLLNINKINSIDLRIVDCDSFQVDGYPCPVGTFIYTSPKLYSRNSVDHRQFNFGKYLRFPEDENYAIASLLFQILMLNESPFASKQKSEIENALLNYNFAFRLTGDAENTGADTPDGPARLIWNNFPPAVKNTFGKVFKKGLDVTPDKWIAVLKKYKKGLLNNEYTREISPKNYWDNKNNEFTRFFNCECCGEYRNTPKERYALEEERNLPHLCAECTQIKFRIQRKKIEKKCIKCKQIFQVSQWNEWLAEKGFRSEKQICEDCLRIVDVKCGKCGCPTTARQYFLRDMNRKGKTVFCEACREKVIQKKER